MAVVANEWVSSMEIQVMASHRAEEPEVAQGFLYSISSVTMLILTTVLIMTRSWSIFVAPLLEFSSTSHNVFAANRRFNSIGDEGSTALGDAVRRSYMSHRPYHDGQSLVSADGSPLSTSIPIDCES
jgi:hypothetical protein